MNNRARALTVLLSVFFAGCIVGASGFFLWTKKHPEMNYSRQGGPQDFRPGGRGGGAGNREWFSKWFSQMLHLSTEQTKSVASIMEERRRRLDAIEKEYAPIYGDVRAKHEPKVKAIISETNHKLSEILNEEQKKMFEDWLKKVEEMRGRGGPRRQGEFGPPPQGRPPQ